MASYPYPAAHGNSVLLPSSSSQVIATTGSTPHYYSFAPINALLVLVIDTALDPHRESEDLYGPMQHRPEKWVLGFLEKMKSKQKDIGCVVSIVKAGSTAHYLVPEIPQHLRFRYQISIFKSEREIGDCTT